MSAPRFSLWNFENILKTNLNPYSVDQQLSDLKKNLQKYLDKTLEKSLEDRFLEKNQHFKSLEFQINIQLLVKKELENILKGHLRKLISKNTAENLKKYFETHVKNIQLSPAVFLLYNEFFIYEMIKNALDAGVKHIHAFIHEEAETVTMTLIDDGKGLKDYLKNPDRAQVLDSEKCLYYLKLFAPHFDFTQPESETNFLSRENKIHSEKEITLTGEKKETGGKGEGLKKIAYFAFSAGGSLLMMDVSDFIKSEKYQKMTGITDLKSLPKTGAVFILNAPKFSQAFKENYEKKNSNFISKNGYLENDYYLTIDPSKKTKLYRLFIWKKPSIKSDEIDILHETPAPTPSVTPTSACGENLSFPSSILETPHPTPLPTPKVSPRDHSQSSFSMSSGSETPRTSGLSILTFSSDLDKFNAEIEKNSPLTPKFDG